MKDESIRNATGRGAEGWFAEIRRAGLENATHKAIAEHLGRFDGVSSWWAQTITVEYEKSIRRRVVGQTAEGGFQIGVSRTLDVPAGVLWDLLESPAGIAVLTGCEADDPAAQEGLEHLDARFATGAAVRTTTYVVGSHFRMKFTPPGRDAPSILQVRVEAKGPGKSVLRFHQEKLPDEASREAMREFWKTAAARLADMLSSAADSPPGAVSVTSEAP